MHRLHRIGSWLLVLLVLAGCASTNVSNREIDVRGKIARPDRILVYDFAATPADVPPEFRTPGESYAPSPSQTPQDLEVGRKLGAEVAKQLVAEIDEMGLPAVQAAGQPPPRVNDILLWGSFLSVDEGSMAKRLVVGFGVGAAELKTSVVGYQMTERGLRRLGSGDVQSGGSKGPGVAVPLAVTIATANPIGLVVGGAVKVAGEATGSDTIEGAGRRTADEIAKVLRGRFEEQGWIARD